MSVEAYNSMVDGIEMFTKHGSMNANIFADLMIAILDLKFRID
jgi:hypothetical protein